jgi:hypothetical protein
MVLIFPKFACLKAYLIPIWNYGFRVLVYSCPRWIFYAKDLINILLRKITGNLV